MADASTPIIVLPKDALEGWLKDQPPTVATWVTTNGFRADLGESLLVPDQDGNAQCALFGWGDAKARGRGRFHFAAIVPNLPEGTYHIAEGLSPDEAAEATLAWQLSDYRFDRYKKPGDGPLKTVLTPPAGVDSARISAFAKGEFLTRDLINTPANDMGPEALETAFFALGNAFGAETRAVVGDDLLRQNLPLIHAVGRASDQAPRLLELIWGNPSARKITLVGKGVCFDTGGLNLKPGASMGLMKKDMGGAATVMGLAHIIMALGLNVRLRVLVPAVENSVSAGAFRPGDILTSRKGLTVEINNTDAEGRLVLADALALADEEAPETLISMATLTGAARVAVGPDIAPFYTNNDSLAHALARAGRKGADPVWRMPFWDPYENMIEPGIADLDNAPSGGFAGSITAALFLRRFVTQAQRFAHFDIYGWNPNAAPARPKGAAFQAARAIFDVLADKSAP